VRNALIHKSPLLRRTAMGLVVFLLAYATAFAETITIAHVSWSTTSGALAGVHRSVRQGHDASRTSGWRCHLQLYRSVLRASPPLLPL